MNIICFTSNPEINNIKEELSSLGNLAIDTSLNLTNQEFIQKAKHAELVIAGPSSINRISKELIDQLPRLKHIALLTVGYDWVDVDYAITKGVVISTIKGATSQSVAEHTWGMILDLSKRITEFNRDAREKGAFKFADYKGKEVKGKTLGIIGLGTIGTKIAHVATAFDMHVLGINKTGIEVTGVTLVDLDELLKKSDIIAIAAPLTDETLNLISDKEFAKMKNGVILVNCAREKIVNKDAVIKAIGSKKLFGYGVETSIMTPLAKDDPYNTYPNIVLTLHNAFNTEDADKKSYQMVLDNIRSFIKGSPENTVKL